MWAKHTATLDWCESNYAVTDFIVEFWNTLSSFSLCFVGLLLMWLYRHEQDQLSFRVRLGHFFVVLVGLGSVYFHATLSYAGQLADELSMFWLVLIVAIDLCGTSGAAGASGLRHTKTQCFLVLCGLLYTWHMLTLHESKTYQVVLFQSAFSGCLFLTLHWTFNVICANDDAYRQFRLGTCSLLVAWMFWLADHFFCDLVERFQLHAVWHLIASVSIYQLAQMQVYVSLQRQLPVDYEKDMESVSGPLVFLSGAWHRVDERKYM